MRRQPDRAGPRLGSLRGWLLYAPPALTLCALLGWAHLDPSGLFTSLRERTFDSYQKLSPRDWRDAGVRLVAIDEPSLEAYGRWPWSRDLVARMIERAADAEAAAIAFAILFAEEENFEADARMAQAAERIPVVLATLLADTARTRAPDPKASFAYSGALSFEGAILIPDYLRATGPREGLAESAAGLGSITLPAEEDGVTRRAPTVQIAQPPIDEPELGAKEHPSLFIETLRAAQHVSTVQLRVAGGAYELNPFGENRLVAVKVGDRAFFTDETGAVRLHYTAATAQRVVSAKDLIEGVAPDLKDKILVVGATAEGLGEARMTPVAPLEGALLHVEALEQALLPRAQGGGFLQRPDWAFGAEMMLAALIGCAVIFAGRLASRWQGIVGLGLAAGAALGSWGAFEGARLLIDPVLPVASAFLCFAVGSTTRSAIEERSRARTRAAFERYMDPKFIKQLETTPDSLTLGHGEVRMVTVMYCDIRDFAGLTAMLKDEPQRLSSLLSDFLTVMGKEIKQGGGAIDKFMGDCVMALWNAPLSDPQHATRACATARKMRVALQELNRKLASEEMPTLAMTIGIESGECVVGNMGSEDRFDFTAIGAAATLAARLQNEAARRDIDVLVGPGAQFEAGPEAGLKDYGQVSLKGWTEPVSTYQLT